jgi:hypothetical protein
VRRCLGRSQVGVAGGVARCPYDVISDDAFCFFHRQVVEGRITTIDGKRGLSWRPVPPVEEPERDPEDGLLQRLLREWDLEDEIL